MSVLCSYFAFGSQNSVVPDRRVVQSNFYCTTVRPVLEYCAPVSHPALPQYLSEDIERVQKRTLSIIRPKVPYSECLVRFGLTTLQERRVALCDKLFNSNTSCPGHKLSTLLPPNRNFRHKTPQDLRHATPRMCTTRLTWNSFIQARALNNYLSQ